MKNVNFIAYQENTELELNFEVSNSNQSKVLGTALNELFAWCNIQREVNAKGLKFSEPINLKIEVNNIAFDTGKANKRLTNKLKMNKTAKSKKSFALKVKAIFDYSIRDFNELTFNELLESLTE